MTRFARYAWAVLAVNLAVVAWGAFVRATGSGAGCGRHWPRCNGEVVPRLASTETLIEFTHRATSGVALLLVVGLVVWAWRAAPRGSAVRRGAAASMALMLVEAGVGAGLVLLELVAGNESLARAGWMAVHLLNTFLLLAAIALTAWWASGGRPVRLRGSGALGRAASAGLALTLGVGVTGAVAALGDTLFPAASLAEGLREDLSPTAHFLVRFRGLHPFLALGAAGYAIWLARRFLAATADPAARKLAVAMAATFVLQIGVGLVNLVLLAPVAMQLVHLLVADAVWLTQVLASAAVLAEPSPDDAGRRVPTTEPPLAAPAGAEAR